MPSSRRLVMRAILCLATLLSTAMDGILLSHFSELLQPSLGLADMAAAKQIGFTRSLVRTETGSGRRFWASALAKGGSRDLPSVAAVSANPVETSSSSLVPAPPRTTTTANGVSD